MGKEYISGLAIIKFQLIAWVNQDGIKRAIIFLQKYIGSQIYVPLFWCDKL